MRQRYLGALNSHPLTGSDRDRILDEWKVVTETIGDKELSYLAGWTIRERDGYRPPARRTTTSHIVTCEGNTVTTRSGSKYRLTDNPEPSWDIHTPEQFVADKFLSPGLIK